MSIGVDRSGDALADALYRFASFHDPPPGIDASPEAVAFAMRFLAHLVWLDVLFGNPVEKPNPLSSTSIVRSSRASISPVMLTAAARTARALVWPADVPESGDLADAFAARLDALAKRAQIDGMPRYQAALGIAELAAAPTTKPAFGVWTYGMIHGPMSVSEPIAPRRMLSLDADVLRVAQKVREVGRALDERYLDKSELVRMLLVTLVAGEHMLIVGPPGTAKSALVRHLARLVDARYFEYLLTRFSEPNELFGPIDIKAFREGTYVRRVEAMLPDADIVFLDEIFKSNSAILNSLLSILNERRFFTGSASIQVPLSSLYGATNEIPNDDALGAVFDRFLVRALSENLDSFHFHGLIERGLRGEIEALARTGAGRGGRRGARAPGVAGRDPAAASGGWRGTCSSPKTSWPATRA